MQQAGHTFEVIPLGLFGVGLSTQGEGKNHQVDAEPGQLVHGLFGHHPVIPLVIPPGLAFDSPGEFSSSFSEFGDAPCGHPDNRFGSEMFLKF